MNTENKKRIVYFTNCSYSKINLKIADDQEFINQFSYKYNIRIFKDDELILKNVYTHLKSMPLDLYFDENDIIQKRRNTKYTKYYGVRTTERKYEGYEEINQILKLKNNQNSDRSISLLSHLIYNDFYFNMTLEELSENEKIIYSKPYSYGQVNYLKDNNPIKKARAYDINSEHPFLMSNEKLLVPMRRGKELLLSSIDEIDDSKVGLYLLNIEFNEKTKYFKPITPKLFYTVSNYFIEILKKTNTKYSLYNNPELSFNSIIYENDDCINLNSILGFKIKKLYEKKQAKCTMSKELLRKMLGMFSRKCGDKEAVKSRQERIKYNSCYIETPNLFFRFKNFIYDMARVNMFKYIEYCQKNDITIYRIKADSIHLSKKLPDEFIDDDKFGFLKNEGVYKLEEGFSHVNDTNYKNYLKK